MKTDILIPFNVELSLAQIEELITAIILNDDPDDCAIRGHEKNYASRNPDRIFQVLYDNLLKNLADFNWSALYRNMDEVTAALIEHGSWEVATALLGYVKKQNIASDEQCVRCILAMIKDTGLDKIEDAALVRLAVEYFDITFEDFISLFWQASIDDDEDVELIIAAAAKKFSKENVLEAVKVCGTRADDGYRELLLEQIENFWPKE